MAKLEIRGEQFQKDIQSGRVLMFHRRNIREALKTHGSEVTTALQKVITSGSRSGRVYSYKGKKYTASAPGEPPANRSGRLASSFGSKATPLDLTVFSTAFSSKGFPYPNWLDNPDGLNRPYFLVTIESLEYRLQKDLSFLDL